MPNHKTRFAVVGLGHISQAAVLPAFEHAENCELKALVSGDRQKLDALTRRYELSSSYSYEEYDQLLESGEVDAVYIALPNHLHADYAVRAAERGIHVLCEKPMAPTEAECERMIEAARENDVRLMIAYRLHLERINLEVSDLVRSGVIGEPRFFSSVFSQNVKPGDIRLSPLSKGGGTVFDMGIYCINAARYLFRDEPIEVTARAQWGTDARFKDCDEMTSAVLRFPEGRFAQFISSFGAVRSGSYQVVGTEGDIVVHNAYDYQKEMSYHLHTADGGERMRRMGKRDQFAPELIHFANCVQKHRDPEPDGWEGYADVRIISAIHEAALAGKSLALDPIAPPTRPMKRRSISRPGLEKPEEIRASSPSQ